MCKFVAHYFDEIGDRSPNRPKIAATGQNQNNNAHETLILFRFLRRIYERDYQFISLSTFRVADTSRGVCVSVRVVDKNCNIFSISSVFGWVKNRTPILYLYGQSSIFLSIFTDHLRFFPCDILLYGCRQPFYTDDFGLTFTWHLLLFILSFSFFDAIRTRRMCWQMWGDEKRTAYASITNGMSVDLPFSLLFPACISHRKLS